MKKKVKNYIDAPLAKKKIERYKYWSIKDESGVTICSSEENNPDNKSFSEILDQIMKDNVDAEIQIRYGTSEQSSRQNPPFFLTINEEIEWIEPEDDETVSINGVPHKLDKNGNVNINLTSSPATISKEQPTEQVNHYDTIRKEMEMQLEGIRREHTLKEERMKLDMQNKLMEQTLKFRELMLAEREARLAEREQGISQQEQHLSNKEKEIRSDLVGYIKQVPSALGAIIKEFTNPDKGLGKSKEEHPPKKERQKADFTVEDEEDEEEIAVAEVIEDDDFSQEDIDEEIAKYEQEEAIAATNNPNHTEDIETVEEEPEVEEEQESNDHDPEQETT